MSQTYSSGSQYASYAPVQQQQATYSNQYGRSFSNASANYQQLLTPQAASRISRSRSIVSNGSVQQQQPQASAVYYASASVAPSRRQSNAQEPRSEVEQAILRSNNPIRLNETEQITVNGVRGIFANRSELANWRGPVPLEQYQINNDPNPEVIRKRATEKVKYTQEVAVRYLQPPTPQRPGDLIIREEPGRQAQPAPPLVIRQLPSQPETPQPLVIREAPPRAPSVFESKVIHVPAKALPPPPRRVVVEKFPELPQKPAPIIIERWLPYKPRKVRVILQKQEPQPQCCSCCPQQQQQQQPEPQLQSSNVLVNYSQQVSVQSNNQNQYQYAPQSRHSSQLPVIAQSFARVTDSYANNNNNNNNNNDNQAPELEGDQDALDALRRVDLDRYGLTEYRAALNRINSRY